MRSNISSKDRNSLVGVALISVFSIVLLISEFKISLLIVTYAYYVSLIG